MSSNFRQDRKKAVADGKVAAAQTERGVLLVNTGSGKGKSSAAFGVVARALGQGLAVAVVQFVKSRPDTGEALFFSAHPKVAWHIGGKGFTWEPKDVGIDAQAAREAWAVAARHLEDPNIGLVVLDELTYAFKHGWLELDAVIAALARRPSMQHVIVTGRAAPAALCAVADTVTDMRLEKHAFQAGVKAMRGLEW